LLPLRVVLRNQGDPFVLGRWKEWDATREFFVELLYEAAQS
jgi:hypothetical protein